MFVKITAILLTVVLLGCMGCTGAIIEQDAFGTPATAVTPSNSWVVSCNFGNAKVLNDSGVGSCLVTPNTTDQAFVVVDMGKRCLFNQVILDHGTNEFGCARRVAVYTSLDGREYTQQYIGPGTRRLTYLNLITPVLARYVRVQVVQHGDRPWSLAEIYIR